MSQGTSKAVRKPAADVKRQIETLQSHQVHFDRCNLDDAQSFLTQNTYFFKLKAFDNKFDKDTEGNYYNLDFSFLQDVSTIDYHIRQVVVQLTSDIEHALKIRFNRLLMRQTSEDGYSIVEDFVHDQDIYYREHFDKPFSLNLKESAYTQAIIEKYSDNPPAWLLWEVCSFNTTNQFYKFFVRKNKYADRIFSLLDGVRLLRNAASHNNCLLTAPSYEINRTEALIVLLEQLVPEQKYPVEHDNVMTLASHDPLIHDFCCVLCCHINLVQSQGAISRTVELLDHLEKRICRNIEWYRDSMNHCGDLERQLNAICILSRAFQVFSRENSRKKNLPLTQEPKVYNQRRTPSRRRPKSR